MKTVLRIMAFCAWTVLLYYLFSESHQRGYIQGCEDTRKFSIEVIREWELSR